MRNRIAAALLFFSLSPVPNAHSEDVESLRAQGPLAVDALHARWKSAAPAARTALQDELDRVCAQKDCHSSRLYWYTDLEQAKIAARELGRPILSLHLLGRLDEELSCANSRFFRALLYSDDAINAVMRDRFVLHWHSVRDVPHVTIDLGGGRVLRQTITGNSAHYLLDANGLPLDVLPGLYSPEAFLAQLERWDELSARLRSGHRAMAVREYHAEELQRVQAEAQRLGLPQASYVNTEAVWAAQLQSRSKAMVEVPMMRKLRRRCVTRGRHLGERSVARARGAAQARRSFQ